MTGEKPSEVDLIIARDADGLYLAASKAVPEMRIRATSQSMMGAAIVAFLDDHFREVERKWVVRNPDGPKWRAVAIPRCGAGL